MKYTIIFEKYTIFYCICTIFYMKVNDPLTFELLLNSVHKNWKYKIIRTLSERS